MSRLCAASGIENQHCLLGEQATAVRLDAALTRAAVDLDSQGLLVLTFTGHSDCRPRNEYGERIFQWCLSDRDVGLNEVARMLDGLAPTVRVVVIADTCYAGAFARVRDVACTLVLIAACAESQTKISGSTSEFAVSLEELVYPGGEGNPDCVSYRWLERQLQRDTPDAQRPQVWTNRRAAWAHRPFTVDRPVAATSGATGMVSTRG
jgi:hypothetical protein